MANPIPCGICEEVDNAEFVISDMTPDLSILGKPTQGMCVRCFIETGLKMAEALQTALAEQSAPEPPEVGALEQIEAEEGPVRVAPSSASPKSRKKPAPESNGAQIPEEAETSDVNG